MIIVLRHTGEFSYYSCQLIGAFDTLQLAEEAVHNLLLDQIEVLKTKLKASSKQRDKNDLERLESGHFTIDNEKDTFQYIDVEVNRARQYEKEGGRCYYAGYNYPELTGMTIPETFSFDSNIYTNKKIDC